MLTGDKPLAKLLNPDYRKSLATVLVDATRYMIKEEANLTILDYVHAYRRDRFVSQGCPSWVPHWHIKDPDYRIPPLSRQFSADNWSALDVWIALKEYSPGFLSVAGFSVDRVSKRSSSSEPGNTGSVVGILRWLEEVQATVPNLSMEDYATTFGAILSCGANAYNKRATEEECADFVCWISYLKDKRQLPPPFHSIRGASEGRDPSVVRASAYQHAFETAKSYRRFFVTDSGLMGLGPRSLEIHDRLVILFGSNWPVLIYQQDDYYSVIGTCYVHGIMDGEVVRKFEGEGRPTETFVLK